MTTSVSCSQSGCAGTVLADGYCDTCGAKAAPPSPVGAVATGHAVGAAVPVGTSARVGSVALPTSPSTRSSGSSRRTSTSRRTGSTRARVGAGLVDVEPTPVGDPGTMVMTAADIAEVVESTPEEQRFCGACDRPVGRSTDQRPGRPKGFCGNCRAPFNFSENEPGLAPGELVGGQYDVVGCLAHGGLGWIYLARDTAVSNRWVVLKGLLDSSDPDAVAAAVAEQQFLARMDHGNIVRIYNFVTWRGFGYIVMEFVGGRSLNAKLKARRRANGGVADPLPVQDAIAYVLAIAPAFSYLHGQGLLYNDLKPANIMAVGDDVKLIDLGAVMRADDAQAAVFGTVGFQAPEVASLGPSVASDVYTIGRTLAVLSLRFVFHDGRYQYALPTPAVEPLFAEWESLYRFLLKCTAPGPDDRFSTVDELAEQLHGVLREMVARTEGRPRPAASLRFTGDQLPNVFAELGEAFDVTAADPRCLPWLVVDPADASAAALVALPDLDAAASSAMLRDAVASQQIELTNEVRLRLVRLGIEDAAGGGATTIASIDQMLDELSTADPWDWRVDWYRGLALLARGAPRPAAESFSSVWTDLPGETAPKLAVALAAENAGDLERAAELYGVVVAVNDGYVSAAFGLARCQGQLGHPVAQRRALALVPTTSAVYIDAQMALARAHIASGDHDPVDLGAAAAIVDRLLLDARTRAEMQNEVLERALHEVNAPGGAAPSGSVFGVAMRERPLREAIEQGYRELARSSATAHQRLALVDQANRVRPRTIW